MPEPSPFKYRAFISYAHADMRWGKWLHRSLESFHIDADLVGRATPMGAVPNTLRPIFRDRDEFVSGQTLTEATIAALDASAALIVICSAEAATRPAVNEEVRLFKSRHPDRPIIPVIVEGTPPENFPPPLRFEVTPDGVVTDQPVTVLAADVREEGDDHLLALAKVIAGITGVGTDDIFRRAERARREEHSRRRRIRLLVISLASSLFILVALAYVGILNPPYVENIYNGYANKIKDNVIKFGDITRDCGQPICPEMVVLPTGKYLMGSPGTEEGRDYDEGPQRMVSIDNTLLVSRYEVTFEQWDYCFKEGGCTSRQSDRDWGRGSRPVVGVTWTDAQQYVNWLTAKTGMQYRLPTEAEWEFAARGVTQTTAVQSRYFWGDQIGSKKANCRGCDPHQYVKKTEPVGSYQPNAFGLYDMHGNVWEWVQDCYQADGYAAAPSDGSPAAEIINCKRVLRGGSWRNAPKDLRSATRYSDSPHTGWDVFGLRVVRVRGSSKSQF